MKQLATLLIGLLAMAGTVSGQTLMDSFSDGDFSSSPAWSGDTGAWTITANSDAAAGATGSNSLRLNFTTVSAGTQYLSTQIASWGDSQEWGLFVGRRAQAFTAANPLQIWLFANESNLESATVDGYRLSIGDDTGGDEIRLEYIVNNAVSATVITSAPITNALTDIGFLVRVTRNSSGSWSLFTSTLPTTNGSGAIASDIPNSTNASVSHGSATNTSLAITANNFFGFVSVHSSGASARAANEFDQIHFTATSASEPTITVNTGSFSGAFGSVQIGSSSSSSSFSVSGSNLTADITIDPPTGFEVRTGLNEFSADNLILTQTGGNVSETTIDVRFKPASATVFSGNVSLTSTGATTQNVAVSGTGINPPSHFRSLSNGTWATVEVWEVSTDLESWSAATAAPVVSDLSITIRAGDTITVAANVTADQITIQDDGALYVNSGITLTLNNGTGDDLTVENGGTLRLGSAGTGTTPSFGTDAVARIKTGGKIQVNGSSLTGNGSGVNTSNFVYETDSVVEWILGTAVFSASGVTYFPNADASTIPILRIATAPGGNPGGSGTLTVNGKLEIANGVSFTWNGTGTKTFRNGIIGTGTMSQSTTGQFIISGATAELGGATINLGANGLSITSTDVSLTGNTTFSGGPVTMSGRLTLTSGTLTTGGNLTFATTGSIAGTGSGSISGNYTLQSTLTGTAGWRLLSSPVSGSTYANVLGPIWTQGATGADVTNGSSNVFWSQGSTTASLVQTAVTDLSTPLTPGRGFAVYVFNDDNYTAEGGTTWPKTLSVTGSENAANTTYTPAWTSGTEYAIAGNPFASTIDWDNVTKGADVHNAVWVWNPATSTYDDYNGANGNLSGGLIAPFQGFWVQYNGTDRGITFPSAAKSTGGSFRGKEETPRRMVVRASDSIGSNLAWVAFRDGATLGEDRYDAVKFTPLSSDYLQAFTIAADKAHGINVLPSDLTDALEIPFGVTSTRGGSITLDLQELNLPDGWVASIRDNVTGETLSMNAEFSYTFESARAKAAPVSETPHVLAVEAPRFTLIIDPSSSTSTDNGKQTTENFRLEQNYPNPFNPSTVVGFQLSVAGQATLKVYDILGREVAVLVNETLPAGAHSVTFDASNLTSGVYLYKLEAGGMTMTKRMTLVK